MILKCFTLFKKGTQPYVRVHFCQRMIAFVSHRESLQRSSTKCCVICSAHRYRLPTLEYQRTLSVHVKHSLCSSTSIIKGSQQRTSVAFGGQCFSQVVISSKKKGRIGIFLTALQLCLWLRGDTPPWGSLCFSVLCLPTIRVFFRTQNLACSTLERTQILESFSWC